MEPCCRCTCAHPQRGSTDHSALNPAKFFDELKRTAIPRSLRFREKAGDNTAQMSQPGRWAQPSSFVQCVSAHGRNETYVAHIRQLAHPFLF